MFIYTISDIIGVSIFLIAVAFAIVYWIVTAFRQWRCNHVKYHETIGCDAICNDCGKNLGFIGNIRDKKPS